MATVPAFLAAGAAFLVVVVLGAFFTTGTAFFFERTDLLAVDAPTLAVAVFFPAAADEPVRDPDTLLTWVPLLAGVIVLLRTTRRRPVPDDDRAEGAGDDSRTAPRGAIRR